MILNKSRFGIIFFLFLGMSILFISSIILKTDFFLKLSKSPAQESYEGQQQNFIPSLYPELAWAFSKGSKTQASDYRIYYSSQKLDGNISLLGKEWVATKQNISEEELLKLESDFRNYYDRKLHKFGWNLDIKTNGFLLQTTNAGGPRGNIWGYVKGGKGLVWAFILQTTRTSMTGIPPPSLGCPCNMEFRVFVSDALLLDNVLPNSL